MFQKILEIFSKHSTLDEVEKILDEMLEVLTDMFIKATETQLSGNTDDELRAYIWKQDEKINGVEKTVRRRLFTHLAIAGATDLSPAMAFLRVIRDAERCGDYVKNIYTVLSLMSEAETGEVAERLEKLRSNTIKQFGNIREVLKTYDEKRAKEIVDFSHRDQDISEQIICDLIKGDSNAIPCNNPVACALLFRYYKRLLSHLIHIAKSVYTPFDDETK